MVLGFAVYCLTVTLRAFSRGSNRNDLQQQAVVVLNHMIADLEATSVAGLAIQNGDGSAAGVPVAIALQKVAGTLPPDGMLGWQQAIVVYAWDPHSGYIVRREFASPDALAMAVNLKPQIPRRVGATVLQQMAATPNRTDRLLARDVTSFKITSGSTDPAVITPPLVLDAVLVRASTSYNTGGERLELIKKVSPRNHT